MPPVTEHEAGIAPFHRIRSAERLNIVVEAERGEALGVLDPVVAHLDEQEQVHAPIEQAFEFGAGAGADRLDALPLSPSTIARWPGRRT